MGNATDSVHAQTQMGSESKESSGRESCTASGLSISGRSMLSKLIVALFSWFARNHVSHNGTEVSLKDIS